MIFLYITMNKVGSVNFPLYILLYEQYEHFCYEHSCNLHTLVIYIRLDLAGNFYATRFWIVQYSISHFRSTL